LRIARKLHQPVAVPQVKEDDPTEIAAAMDPAAQTNRLADVSARERTATMGTKRGTGRRWAVSQEQLGVNGSS
jgi:hypothetical protein